MITSELPSTLLKDTEFSVLDVETTGLSARDNFVIEIWLTNYNSQAKPTFKLTTPKKSFL
jgi:DNA polymerase III alpha subunit (gram-positive type)